MCRRWRKLAIRSSRTLHGSGFFLPAKTPADIVESLDGGIQEALRADEVKSGMAKLSVEIDAIWHGSSQRPGRDSHHCGLSFYLF